MKGIVNEEKASSNSKKYKRKSIKVVFITLIIIFFAVLLGFMSSEESGPVNYKEYKYKFNVSPLLPLPPTYVILGEDKGGFLCQKKLRLQTWTLSGKTKKQISFNVRK